jgi:hypothetical protein
MLGQTPPTRGAASLVLRSFQHAHLGEVRVFSTEDLALRHVADHLLTMPEAAAWALVAEELGAPSGVWSYGARSGMKRDIGAGDASAAQPLYDAYADQIRLAATQAAVLGWVAFADGVCCLLSLSGVLVLATDRRPSVVKTALLPGQGSGEAVREQQVAQQAGEREARRDSTPMRKKLRRGRSLRGEREESAQAEREEGWTSAERLFHRVFRPALRFVRQSRMDRSAHGGLTRHYHILQPVLPSVADLPFERWLALREGLPPGEPAEA